MTHPETHSTPQPATQEAQEALVRALAAEECPCRYHAASTPEHVVVCEACNATGLAYPWASREFRCSLEHPCHEHDFDDLVDGIHEGWYDLEGCKNLRRVPLSDAELQAALIAQESFITLIHRDHDKQWSAWFRTESSHAYSLGHTAKAALVAAFAAAKGVTA